MSAVHQVVSKSQSGNLSLLALFLAIAASAAGVGGCWSSTTETSRAIEVRQRESVPPHVERTSLRATRPIVAVFIGVSNYGASSPFEVTPAHTLSAAIMADTFLESAARVKNSTRAADIRSDTPHVKMPTANMPVKVSGLPRSEIVIAADLVMPSNSPQLTWIDSFLARAPATKSLCRGAPRRGIEPSGKDWTLFDNGKLVTKQRMLAAIREAVDHATENAQAGHAVLLVAYISAHGWRGPDGRSYALPGDMDPSDAETWLAYDDVVKEVSRFTYSVDPLKHHALVILDTCQKDYEGSGSRTLSTREIIPPGMTIVESTAPGNYAWHMDDTMRVEGFRTIFSHTGEGSRPRSGPIDQRGDIRMSVFPVAMRHALTKMADRFTFQPAGLRTPRNASPEMAGCDPPSQIRLEEWLHETSNVMQQLLDGVATFKAAGGRQELQVQFGIPRVDVPLFDFLSSTPAENVNEGDK